MGLEEGKVINGAFGKMYHDGQWMTNVTQAQASVEVGKEEVKIAGSRWKGHKVMSLAGSGTMTGYKVSTTLARQIGQVASDSGKPFVTELVMKLEDPENHDGKVWIRLKNVQFDSIPLLKYEHGSMVEEETPFTFRGYDYL